MCFENYIKNNNNDNNNVTNEQKKGPIGFSGEIFNGTGRFVTLSTNNR